MAIPLQYTMAIHTLIVELHVTTQYIIATSSLSITTPVQNKTLKAFRNSNVFSPLIVNHSPPSDLAHMQYCLYYVVRGNSVVDGVVVVQDWSMS